MSSNELWYKHLPNIPYSEIDDPDVRSAIDTLSQWSDSICDKLLTSEHEVVGTVVTVTRRIDGTVFKGSFINSSGELATVSTSGSCLLSDLLSVVEECIQADIKQAKDIT